MYTSIYSIDSNVSLSSEDRAYYLEQRKKYYPPEPFYKKPWKQPNRKYKSYKKHKGSGTARSGH